MLHEVPQIVPACTAGKSAGSHPDIQGANCDVKLIMIGEPHWSLDASIPKMMSLPQQEG